MTPALNSVVCSDALALCRELPEASVNCVVTSPPYFGLRDYGTAKWEGGDPDCQHSIGNQVQDNKAPGAITSGVRPGVDASHCRKCGAKRVDGQIGLEETPAAYVEKLVELFREIWRVLRDDGTVWVNLGDSYWNSTFIRSSSSGAFLNKGDDGYDGFYAKNGGGVKGGKRRSTTGMKEKNLLGIPWRVAFALQDDGWILRSDIVWAKPNPMPESVTDRPTKAHEYIFLLTKQGDYFYDQEAVREKHSREWWTEHVGPKYMTAKDGRNDGGKREGNGNPLGRNLRSVWTIPTEPTPFAHFATFPRKLVERCVLAGCPSKVCAKCGAPWIRIVEKMTHFEGGSGRAGRTAEEVNGNGKWAGKQYGKNIKLGPVVSTSTLGFRPTCDCQSDTRPGLVFDPFMGSGTVALVARALGRDYIGCDLNPDYVKLANDRLSAPFTPPLFDLDAPAAPLPTTLPLWEDVES